MFLENLSREAYELVIIFVPFLFIIFVLALIQNSKYQAIRKKYNAKAILSIYYNTTGIGFEGMYKGIGYMILCDDTLIFTSEKNPDKQINISLNKIEYFHTYFDTIMNKFKIFYTVNGKSTYSEYYTEKIIFNIYAAFRNKYNILRYLEKKYPSPPKTITQI